MEKNISKEEQVGFHKGSLSVLIKERQELSKIIQVIEQLMQIHLKELKSLGVDLSKQAKEQDKDLKSKKAIEEIIK